MILESQVHFVLTRLSLLFLCLETGGLLRLAVKLMQAASDSTVYVSISGITIHLLRAGYDARTDHTYSYSSVPCYPQ